MSKQTLTMELDVPDGYELTGEVRPPRRGEPNLTLPGSKFNVAGHDFDCESRVILRKGWEAPAWVPEGCWVYWSADGWYASLDEPVENGIDTGVYGAKRVLFKFLGGSYNFSAPKRLKKIQVKRAD